MTQPTRDFVKTLDTYEKQELVTYLTQEIHNNYNTMLGSLISIDGHVFGMINNSAQNALNELTCLQLSRIKELSSKTRELIGGKSVK